METKIIPHIKQKRKGKSEWKLREPTIPEIRTKLKAIRKQVEKDYWEYQCLVSWILELVEMAFGKVKD